MKRFLKNINFLLTYFEKNTLKNWVNKNKFILLLLAIVFVLRIPSLFEPYWYGDEGIYLGIGLAIRKGFLLYRDVFDNKPPMIYLMAAAAGGTIFWFRFFLMTSVLLAIFFFYRLALLLFENKNKGAKISVIVFCLLTTVRAFEGNVGNSEIFVLLPTVLGFFLTFKYYDKLKRNFTIFLPILFGSILSIGFLYKVPAVFDFVTLVIFLALLNSQEKAVNLGKKEIFLIVGYLIPISLVSLFFLFRGIFSQYVNSVFVQMFGYLSSWKTGTHAFSLVDLLKSELVIKAVLVTVIIFLLWMRRKNLNRITPLIGSWFAFSLFGATLSGRPYPHYLVQIIPSLSLFFGFLFFKKAKKETLILSLFIFLFCLFYAHYHTWTYTTISYYQNFISLIDKTKDRKKYFGYFNQELPRLYDLGEKIKVYSKDNDAIFIWGDEPSLYPMTKRLPATPYLAAYHVIDLNEYNKTISALMSQNPTLIIIDNSKKSFPQLNTFVKSSYIRTESVGKFTIFSKIIKK